MSVRQVTTFDATDIKRLSLQFGDAVDVINCVGTVEGTTEMRAITRVCKGVESSISKPQKLTVTINAFVPVETARDLFGLDNTGLKKGVYGYGAVSKGKELALVMRLADDFSDKEKIVAIPKARTTSGLTFSLDGDGTDVAKMSITVEGSLDELNNLYYEAMVGSGNDELAESEATKWETGFKTTLVKNTGA